MIYHDLFFLFIQKWAIVDLIDKNYYKKAKHKCHNWGGKEEAAKYYPKNRWFLKEKGRTRNRNFSEDKKEVKRQYGRNRYKNMKKMQVKKVLKKWNTNYSNSIKMSKKTLNFNNIEFNKTEIHVSN